MTPNVVDFSFLFFICSLLLLVHVVMHCHQKLLTMQSTPLSHASCCRSPVLLWV